MVSGDAFNANELYLKVLVVHLTSVHRPGGPYPWEVEIPKGVAGLPRSSTAKCAEVYTFFKSDLTGQVGTLPADKLAEVNSALSLALELG